MTHEDAIVVTSDRADVHGVIASGDTGMYVLNQLTVGPDFDSGQYRPGQRIRIFFEGIGADGQPKIHHVSSLS